MSKELRTENEQFAFPEHRCEMGDFTLGVIPGANPQNMTIDLAVQSDSLDVSLYGLKPSNVVACQTTKRGVSFFVIQFRGDSSGAISVPCNELEAVRAVKFLAEYGVEMDHVKFRNAQFSAPSH